MLPKNFADPLQPAFDRHSDGAKVTIDPGLHQKMKTHLPAYAICFALFAFAHSQAAPTDSLVQYSDTFTVQKPYDLNISDRFSVTAVSGGLQYNCWINHSDHSLYPGSPTAPRSGA